MPSDPKSLAPLSKIATVAGLMCAAPCAFLVFYRRTFDYHPLIVVFGSAAVLMVLSVIGLAALGLGTFWPSNRSRMSAGFVGMCTAVLFGGLACIYAGAYISNAIWGDTLNYAIAQTMIAHSGVLVDFLPVSPARKDEVFWGIVAAATVSMLLIVGFALFVSSRLVARLHPWLNDAAFGRRRTMRLAGALTATSIVFGGVCVAIISLDLPSLYGEPITGFFKLVSASHLMRHDNMRLGAAIEDRDGRVTYPKPAKFTPKNVILIVSDALRADRMGVYGYNRPTTPFLSDLFAKKQLHRVDMALSTCSETYCGVASTLASRPFHQLSSFNFKLHDLLRDMGYRTNFFLSGDHRHWNYLFDFYGPEVDALYDFKTLGAKDLNDDRNIIQVLEKVDPAGQQPNFFFFFLMSTHVTGTRLPEFDRFKPSFSDSMRLLTFWNELAGTRRVDNRIVKLQLSVQDLEAVANRYDNGVLQADAYMQRIFALLASKGYLRNSIVVILGDHGDGLGEHSHIGHTRYLYQEDIRIPLLIYDSDMSPYRNDSFASQTDIAPTIVERLGLPIPAGWQGRSLTEPSTDRITLHQTRRGQSPCFAVVKKTAASLMKYIRCGPSAASNEALFDLIADPAERNNLATPANADRLDLYRREVDSRFRVVFNACRSFECRD